MSDEVNEVNENEAEQGICVGGTAIGFQTAVPTHLVRLLEKYPE